MARYREADENVKNIMEELIKDFFPNLVNAEFCLVFDSKKKTSKGKIVVASIKPTNAFIQFLSEDKVADGYDYVMYVDENIWDELSDEDKKRVIRHELMHCFVDENGNYKTIGHDFEGFHLEMEMESNGGDTRWGERISDIAESVYDNG